MDFGCVRKEIAGARDAAKRNPRDKLFAGDKTLDSEFEALGDVTDLARYHRDFHALLHRVILILFLPALKGWALWIRRVHDKRGSYCWHEAPVEEVTAPKAAASEASDEPILSHEDGNQPGLLIPLRLKPPIEMRAWFFGFLIVAQTVSAAEKLTVAAAANFVFALDDLQTAFAQAEPGVELTISTGSSGGLAAQIKHGAPFDVFLSADLNYPQALIDTNSAQADSLHIFAVGRLVLWTTTPGVELASIQEFIQAPAVKRIAIANVDTAPYGRAARETLMRLNLWEALQPKIVFGENVSQTAQYVETGNAQAGFVALSLLHSPRLKERGRWLAVPPELHAPLEHGAVITKHGASNHAARRFVAFLSSKTAQEVLQQFGYDIP